MLRECTRGAAQIDDGLVDGRGSGQVAEVRSGVVAKRQGRVTMDTYSSEQADW